MLFALIALVVCELLEKLYEQFRDLPIVLIMDNARYQKCKLVLEKAASLNIQIIFLPPYSPNLNLIERLWKFVKKEVLYNKFYKDLEFRLIAHDYYILWLSCHMTTRYSGKARVSLNSKQGLQAVLYSHLGLSGAN